MCALYGWEVGTCSETHWQQTQGFQTDKILEISKRIFPIIVLRIITGTFYSKLCLIGIKQRAEA
jgi:hypothetical protein